MSKPEQVISNCVICNAEITIDKAQLEGKNLMTIGHTIEINAKDVYFKCEVFRNDGDLCPTCAMQLMKYIIGRLH